MNADDFGADARVNAAVERAHAAGVLTSASLMVNEPAAVGAADIARGRPALGVGLHLALSDGLACLPHCEIPRLADASGRFRPTAAMAGLVCFFSRSARRQVAREVEAQFERFERLGLPWSHVDGHQHLHIHPVVWDALLRQCGAHGVRCVRVPGERDVAGAGASLARRAEAVCLRAMRRRCLRTLAGRGFAGPDRVYGHLRTGQMDRAYVARLLGRLEGATNEVYFHPGSRHARPLPGGPAHMDADLDALLSPEVRQAVEAHGLRLATYTDLC